MKKFIGKLLVFCLLFGLSLSVLLVFGMCVVKNQYLGNYQAAILDKVQRLQSIDEPKIILTGNSSLSFGMDSRLLEEELGMPVVNLGLHGGLGNPFQEDMAKLELGPGDILVVCNSDYMDDDSIKDTELMWITIEYHLPLWRLLRPQDYGPMLAAYPKYLVKAGLQWIKGSPGNIPQENTCYSRSSFNEYGDVCVRYDGTYTFDEDSLDEPGIDQDSIDRLNRLNAYARSQGATMVLAGFPIAYGEFTPPAASYIDMENKMRENLDCQVISHFTDYFFPYDLFYDTQLHLTWEGAQLRTMQLAEDLENSGLIEGKP